MYHDIYNSLFTFYEINSIKIFVKNNIIDQSNFAYNTTPSIDNNVTLIPLSGDYKILSPNKTMERKWYTKNTNYWDVFSDNIFRYIRVIYK
jgi:hypothetical protein